MWGFFFLHSVVVTSVEKVLKRLDAPKFSEIDQISVKFLKDAAPVIVVYLANIINPSIKLHAFPLQCSIAKVKPFFKREIKTDAKIYRSISLLPLISKVTEKYIHDQTQDYFKRN